MDCEPFALIEYKLQVVDKMSEAWQSFKDHYAKAQGQQRASMISMQGPIHLSLVIECLCTCQDPRQARCTSWHAHIIDPIMWILHWTVDICTVDKPNPTPIGVTLNCVRHCSAVMLSGHIPRRRHLTKPQAPLLRQSGLVASGPNIPTGQGRPDAQEVEM